MEPKKLFNNQRHVRTIKLPVDKYHPYALFNIESLEVARKTLSGGAFKLYTYFAAYSPSYHEYLSTKNIISRLGISDRSYRNAFDELERFGYLQHDPQSSDPDYYIFVESSATASRNS